MTGPGEPQTPFAVVDPGRVRSNARRLKTHLAALGVPLRLHVKTAKSVDVARLVLGAQTGPIAVSTLAEAEHFAAAGFTDIVYAVGIAPGKLERVLRLRERGADLVVLLDSAAQADAVAAASRAAAAPIPALVEIDCDGHRSGLAPEDPALVDVARVVGEGAELRGVLTHAGESYAATGAAELHAAAENERDGAVRAAERLRAAGLDCPVVSVGSTPTAFAATDLTGVTEVRAGNFVFFDRVMARLGVCRPGDIALSVVVTVIGHQRARSWTITDGGWTATSPDHGEDGVYGLVADLHGNVLPDLAMVGANQEHGIIAPRPGATLPPPDLPIGSRLRILPHHACATATQHAGYVIEEPDRAAGAITRRWTHATGW